MLDLGLTRAEYRSYTQALRDNHRIRLDVRLLNRDEEPIDNLQAPINRVLDGEISVDTSADITRSLSMTLLDPDRQLRFEPDSPAHGVLYADRFIAVRYEVYVGELEDWISCPVFWGPLSGFSRAGSQVTIEAQGKEALLLDPHFVTKGYTLQKGMELDEAIKRVARRAGERRFTVPKLGHHRLAKARSVLGESEPWRVLTGGEEDSNGKKIPGLVTRARGDRFAFYDGRGRLVVRRQTKKRAYTFKEGRDLLTDPQVDYDLLAFRNTAVVRGGKPKGKKPAAGRATLPPRHPLSPESLSRNGEPRYMTTFVEADSLKTDRDCDERAKETVERLAEGGVSASFECLPIPMLEEGDKVVLSTDEWELPFRIREFTLPLSAAPMSIGPRRKISDFWRRGQKHKRRRQVVKHFNPSRDSG